MLFLRWVSKIFENFLMEGEFFSMETTKPEKLSVLCKILQSSRTLLVLFLELNFGPIMAIPDQFQAFSEIAGVANFTVSI